MSNWNIRTYEQGDEEAIKELYEYVFNVPMSLELWRWRYLDNPTGRVTILLAFSKEDQTLAGQYALCPVTMKLGSQELIGALSLDTMVRPDFRGQNMFTKMADDLYQRILSDGIPLIFGFPNSQSHIGFTKYLGWKDLVTTLPIYVRPLKFSSLLRKIIKSELLSNLLDPLAKLSYKIIKGPYGTSYRQYIVKKLTGFDERFNILWQQVSEIAQILVCRDRDYLNWRYTSHPESNYTIFAIEREDALLGYCILRIQELAGMQVGFIADLLVQPEEKYGPDALLEAAIKNAEIAGCTMVNCLMLEHIPYVAALKRRGFMLAPSSVFPQEIHLGVRNNGSRQSDSFIHNSVNWFITWGDHDRI